MSSEKDYSCSHYEIPSITKIINQNAQRTANNGSGKIGNSNYSSCRSLCKAESFLVVSIRIVQKRDVLGHG